MSHSKNYRSYRYCESCGLWYQIGNSKESKWCPICLPTMEPDLIIDIGEFHLEARTYAMPNKMITRIVSKSCQYAKKLEHST